MTIPRSVSERAVVLLLVASVAGAQEPAPRVTFRAEVNYVEVDVRIVDIGGTFIRDLGPEDLELFEDDVRQTIDTFAFVDLPLEGPDPPLVDGLAVEPDVASNARPLDGRLYILVLDDLHTPFLRTYLVREAARRFVETRLGASDRAAIITTGGASAMSQPFTDNRRRLIETVDRFTGGTFALRPAQQALRTIENAAEFLAGLRGRRKTLLYVSEGINMGMQDFQIDARMAIAAATRHNVGIYAIDPRGATVPGEDVTIQPIIPESSAEVAERQARGLTRPPPGPDAATAQRDVRNAHVNLRILTEETGGFAVLDTNDLDAGLDRIVAESSSYYLLGYYPANDRRDGRARRIEVRTRRPGVQVLARSGYIEPRGDAPAAQTTTAAALGVSSALADAMTAPLPLSGLPLSATAAAFEGTAPNASVAVVVEVDASRLPLREDGDAFKGALELSVSAFDADGELAGGERYTLTLALSRETLSQDGESRFRMLSRIDLPAGRYQIRVGGRVADTDAVGTVFYDLDVPDFAGAGYGMSDLLLTSSSSNRTPTPRDDPRIAELLPSPPTTQRDFPEDDDLTLFAEMYDHLPTPHTVEITTTVVAEDGRVELTESESLSEADWQAGAGRHEHRFDIPLWTLTPGRYVLKVEARSDAWARTLARQIPFRIRP